MSAHIFISFFVSRAQKNAQKILLHVMVNRKYNEIKTFMCIYPFIFFCYFLKIFLKHVRQKVVTAPKKKGLKFNIF